MKILTLSLISISLFLGCGSGEDTETIPIVDQVTNVDQIFTIDDFKTVGFKKSKEYKVDELPGATSAFYGFIKNKLDFHDVEVRNSIAGTPKFKIKGTSLKNLKRLFKNKNFKIHLSLSDDKPWAIASVIVFVYK